MKHKNHIIISMYAEESFNKIQHPFIIKTFTNLAVVGMYLNLIKAIYDKFTANLIMVKL